MTTIRPEAGPGRTEREMFDRLNKHCGEIERQRDDLQTYNATRTAELLAATRRIVELERKCGWLLDALKYLSLHKLWINSHAKAIIEAAIAKVKHP